MAPEDVRRNEKIKNKKYIEIEIEMELHSFFMYGCFYLPEKIPFLMDG